MDIKNNNLNNTLPDKLLVVVEGVNDPIGPVALVPADNIKNSDNSNSCSNLKFSEKTSVNSVIIRNFKKRKHCANNNAEPILDNINEDSTEVEEYAKKDEDIYNLNNKNNTNVSINKVNSINNLLDCYDEQNINNTVACDDNKYLNSINESTTSYMFFENNLTFKKGDDIDPFLHEEWIVSKNKKNRLANNKAGNIIQFISSFF